MLEANYKSPDGTRQPQICFEFLLTCVADVVCTLLGEKKLWGPSVRRPEFLDLRVTWNTWWSMQNCSCIHLWDLFPTDLHEWMKGGFVYHISSKRFHVFIGGVRNTGPEWTVNLGWLMEDWTYLAVLAYFIRKVILPHIELGALKIKEEVISKYIYICFGFFLETWFQTPSNVEKDRSFLVLDGKILMSFKKLRLS